MSPQFWLSPSAGGEVVDAGDELLSVGEADGVGPTESDHFAGGEAEIGENGEHFVEGYVGFREAIDGEGGVGDEAVFAADDDGVEGAADEGDEVVGGDGEDVGAGDDARAVEFQGGFGADDDVEAVAGEGEVDVGVALDGEEGGVGDEGGGVAAGDEAVVEEEAEGGGGGGGEFFLIFLVLNFLGFFEREGFLEKGGGERREKEWRKRENGGSEQTGEREEVRRREKEREGRKRENGGSRI
ncbi:hypothetical protein RND81_01G073700 [Saponaria officinalis]|uniref:Uncharacterized protein n=1 Tax=Saponaria officinalis TaxID=3572 RepID=A0AAW1N644_SAPOF